MPGELSLAEVFVGGQCFLSAKKTLGSYQLKHSGRILCRDSCMDSHGGEFPPEKIFRSHLGAMQGVGAAFGSLPIPHSIALFADKNFNDLCMMFSESSVDL